jgi:fermentation-respiration switch protein FrsA (DUF1100 family)
MTFLRCVKRLTTLLVFAYGVLVVVALGCSDQLLFHPHPAGYRDDATIIKLHTADGETISARYFAAPGAKYTILHSHGNGEDIGDDFWVYERFAQQGFNVLGYDYHGYGTSTGSPGEEGTYRDIDAAYDYLTGTLKTPPERIILLGKSVGSGPAVDLAARKPVAGLILESAFTSVFRVPFRVRILPWDKFDNLAKLPKVHCPVLVIHGKSDGLVSVWHGEKLFEAANEPKRCLWIDHAGHNDVLNVGSADYDKALADFVRLLDQH